MTENTKESPFAPTEYLAQLQADYADLEALLDKEKDPREAWRGFSERLKKSELKDLLKACDLENIETVKKRLLQEISIKFWLAFVDTEKLSPEDAKKTRLALSVEGEIPLEKMKKLSFEDFRLIMRSFLQGKGKSKANPVASNIRAVVRNSTSDTEH